MASELQHERWRDDIRSNVERAGKNGLRARRYAPHAAMVTTGLVMIAERIGEHTKFLADRDEQVDALMRRVDELVDEVDRLKERS